MKDDTAAVLGTALRLIEQYGHDATAYDGSPVTGFSVPGAIERAAQYATLYQPDTAPYMGAHLGKWLRVRAALDYVATVLGYQPGRYDIGQVRDLVTFAGDGAGPQPLGTAWAVAVLDQAKQLAAEAVPATPAALTSPAELLPVVAAR